MITVWYEQVCNEVLRLSDTRNFARHVEIESMARKTEHLTIGRRRIEGSNLNKVFYPGTKFTKAELIDYYVKVAKYILPHLKDRQVTLKRYPDGVFGEAFYEKDAPAFTPTWVKTARVPRRETPGSGIRYILVNDLPTLVWAANLASIELHPFLHRAGHLDRPTAVVFDGGPGARANNLHSAEVALHLREVL